MANRARIADLFVNDHEELSGHREEILQLSEKMDRIERAVSHSLQYLAHESGLPFLDSQVLVAAYELQENARPSMIAERVRIPLSTMTGVVSRLERQELVARGPASNDGRAYTLSVTPKGVETMKAMLHPVFDELSVIIRDMPDETIQSILGAFEQVCSTAESLESQIRGKSPV